MTKSWVRKCPYCLGAPSGCSECSYTGQSVSTFMERPDGVTARISGNAPLTPETEEAIAAIIDAAHKMFADETP